VILGEYSDTHSDTVTGLKFSNIDQSLLCSSSEDGLICVYCVSTSTEEEAVISVFNTECPVRKFGFFGDTSDGIYALSTVETASFWHIPSAQRLASFPNVRETLGVDYLVDCFYELVDQKLTIVAGTYDGGIVASRIEPSGLFDAVRFNGGHSATVRCCAWLPPPSLPSHTSGSSVAAIASEGISITDTDIGSSSSYPSVAFSSSSSGAVDTRAGVLVTGGEDARVCSWLRAVEGCSPVRTIGIAIDATSTSSPSVTLDSSRRNKHRDGARNELKGSQKQRFSGDDGNLRNKPY
jgi:WD40 repeat protein